MEINPKRVSQQALAKAAQIRVKYLDSYTLKNAEMRLQLYRFSMQRNVWPQYSGKILIAVPFNSQN